MFYGQNATTDQSSLETVTEKTIIEVQDGEQESNAEHDYPNLQNQSRSPIGLTKEPEEEVSTLGNMRSNRSLEDL